VTPRRRGSGHDATRREGEGAWGDDAYPPEGELTDQEPRDTERWLARIRQALADKRAGRGRSLLPDPQLTGELRDVCATIAEAMANNEAPITEALTDASLRAEIKQLASGLAMFLLVLSEEDGQPNAETPKDGTD
jgi:hypothetical protein